MMSERGISQSCVKAVQIKSIIKIRKGGKMKVRDMMYKLFKGVR